MRASIVAVLLAAVAVRGAAQSSPAMVPDSFAMAPDSSAMAPDSSLLSGARPSPAIRPELGRNTAVMLSGALGAGLVVSLFDSRLLSSAQHWGDRPDLQRTATIGDIIGGPVPITLGAVLYAAGRGTRSTFATNTGREVVRAVLVSGAVGVVAKGLVGRSRPFASPGDADEYSPGRGFLNNMRASFPSGHTSAAFATATVLAREVNAYHPHARWVVDPLLFGGAALVGFSRVYDNQHWPSDVIAGAALGAITGYEVVAHAHGDRAPIGLGFLSHLSVGPSRHGFTVGWSKR